MGADLAVGLTGSFGWQPERSSNLHRAIVLHMAEEVAESGTRPGPRRSTRTGLAVELARKGVPLNVIQRQLGHANLGTTSIYLQGIDTEEIIATAGLQL